MPEQYSPTIIIGAGPAGLAVAGRLRKMNLPFEVLEKSDRIASSWHGHYDRLCLHTVKQLSALPHLPFPDSYPLYVPRADLARYYEKYAAHFAIKPHFNVQVVAIKQTNSGSWRIQTSRGTTWSTRNVVVATGINRVPVVPSWPGQDRFQGKVVHSRYYKNAEPYIGQKVLVIGFGNTGAEVALDLCENGIEPCVSVRSPINVVPRDINGRPAQLTARQLAKLPFGMGDWLGTQIRKWLVGDLSRYGLEHAAMHPVEQLRETGKTPLIDLGTIDQVKAGKIKIVPDVASFDETSVVFTDGSRQDFDSVILATGYRADIDEFFEDTTDLLDQHDWPKQPVFEGARKGLYFIGFDNYKLGGILGTIYDDSEIIATTIRRHSS